MTFLAENPNHVFTKEELFNKIWDMESIGDILRYISRKSVRRLSLIHRTSDAALRFESQSKGRWTQARVESHKINKT